MYPWHFEAHALPASPFYLLLHSWEGPITRFLFGDVLVNIALYIPFGMAAFAWFRRWRRSLLGWFVPVLLGALLSGMVEMLQLFVPGRHCSTVDLVCNIAGSAVGVLAGWVFEELGAIRFIETRAHVRIVGLVDRAALALLFCGAAWLVFPLFPVGGRTVLRQKIVLFLHASPAPVAFLTAAVCWLVAGRLLAAAGRPAARKWLGFATLLIPAQILIVYRQPVWPELLGAAIGFVLFVLLRSRVPDLALALVFVSMLLLRGLAPFDFTDVPAEFTWVPLNGFLAMDWREGMVVLLEKLFFYGTAVWLFRAAGQRLTIAAATVAGVLAVIEVAQMWLPAHTSEITDPLLALAMAGVIKACQPNVVPLGARPVEVLPS